MNKGKLIVFSGPSGVGKGTIREKIFDKFENIKFSISCTTRQTRDGEIDGVDYYFLSKEEFLQKVENDEFLEYAEFAGNYYGTLQSVIEEELNNGKNVMLEIECVGALLVMEKMPDAITIFMLPPSIEELYKRLTNRGTEDIDTINKRIEKAKGEIELKSKYKYNIVNDTPEQAVEDMAKILNENGITN